MAKRATNKRKVELGSAFDLLPKSWEIVKKNWQTFAILYSLTLLSAFLGSLPGYEEDGYTGFTGAPLNEFSGLQLSAALGAGLLTFLIIAAVFILLYAMTTILEVRATEGKTPTVGLLFEEANKNWLWLRLVGLALLSVLILIVGLILLIIPGIIAYGRIIMAPYHMIDKDLGVIDALKASNQMAKEFPGKVWAAIGVTILVTIAVGILGVIPVLGTIAGTLLAIAWSLVIVLRYQQLKKFRPAKVK